MQLNREDAAKVISLGGLGLAACALTRKLAPKKHPVTDLGTKKAPVEAIHNDPTIAAAFGKLKHYRELEPDLFDSGLCNADRLLFLENALATKQVYPKPEDKTDAFVFFRASIIQLDEFQHLVRDQMGNGHGLAVNACYDTIYRQMQQHLLNVLRLCSQLNLSVLIEQAPLEIERIKLNRQLKSGRRRE